MRNGQTVPEIFTLKKIKQSDWPRAFQAITGEIIFFQDMQFVPDTVESLASPFKSDFSRN